MNVNDPIGPAFDANTLSTPTPRKLVGCWMDQAGLRTLIVPQVWDELTHQPPSLRRQGPIVESWLRIRRLPEAPYRWEVLDDDQIAVVEEVLSCFTQACFPRTPSDRIATNSDAIIVAEAVAVGAEALVTGDINSIDHYEVNDVLRRVLGRNAEFVTTLDNGLCKAHAGGEASERLLALALATIAPPPSADWTVDAAHDDLQQLRKALAGSRLVTTSARLECRWEQALDLESVLDQARRIALESPALCIERLRTQWHRESRTAP